MQMGPSPDNPFYTSARGKRRAIWALGLRDPFKFAVQPGAEHIFINDVGSRGPGVFEEINLGRKGGYYGWPLHEGPSTDAPIVSPLYAYTHDAGACAITGGTFFDPPARPFPVEYPAIISSPTCARGASDAWTCPPTPCPTLSRGHHPVWWMCRSGQKMRICITWRVMAGLVNRIEYQSPAPGIELLDNGSFETPSAVNATLPEAWRGLGVTTDRLVCVTIDRPDGEPDRLVRVRGAVPFASSARRGNNARLTRRVAGVAVAPGDVLTLSGVVRRQRGARHGAHPCSHFL